MLCVSETTFALFEEFTGDEGIIGAVNDDKLGATDDDATAIDEGIETPKLPTTPDEFTLVLIGAPTNTD